MSSVIESHHDDHHHGPAKGLMRWLLTTNHKDIGSLYLWFSFAMFLIGGAMAMVIRAELFQPGMQIVEPEFYNQMLTLHGLIMVFGAVMPAFVGLANWLIPMMVGAPDMALPRLNNLSFWLLPFAFGILLSSLFMEGGAPNFGWTFYAPLSTTYAPPSVTFFIFSVHVMGASSIMGSINVIVTIMNMRAPGMDLMKMPLFVWSWLITAYLLIAVMPVLAGAVTMMLMDIHFGTSFFNAAGGGDPVLFQHIFWFFGHPEVYIMILPAFGIISHIIETFARKQLFGYESMVWAMLSIAILSFVVWAHHMFTVGMPLAAELFFMWATMLIAVPTGVKVFNWVATMFKGSISFETPMLFAIAFVVLFTIGGFSGLMLSIVPADFQYHDTYFVVAHFHYVLVPGSIFSIMAAVYYWIPKWTGNMYDERMGRLHFWLSFVGVNVTFFPQHWIGLAGMPRRYPDYALQFADWNMVSTAGAFLFGASQILFLFIVLKTVMGGKKATPQVWEGARGLEWSVDSPAPYHTFSTPPKVN
ncbi:MAG: cytochrome c oxidase subunit I [Gammaproteobacteria bacterium]|nr:cytochrome c oxidase subunit I [Gammaproteobacteria bacterium]|tara:strand:- start:1197 stop:2780 length:1584 start_codon:yes stop_codon:yes gene_type:complete